MGDIVWEGSIDVGPGGPGPSFWFWLPLINLDDDQVERVLLQARAVVHRYEDSDRAVTVNAYRGIVQAADARLAGTREPNIFQVRATPQLATVHQMDGDATVAITRAREYAANDSDPMVAAVWQSVASGFQWTQFRMRVPSSRRPSSPAGAGARRRAHTWGGLTPTREWFQRSRAADIPSGARRRASRVV